jgi:nicotinamide-nucleotide amidase
MNLEIIVDRIGELFREKGIRLATAESCTGGLVANLITDAPGSSDWFVGGVVSYSNELKSLFLGVEQEIFNGAGAVSRECVEAMAGGICRATGSDVGVALSGIAGPGGGSELKPVGTVWVAWSFFGHITSECLTLSGSRKEVKFQSSWAALEGTLERALQSVADKSSEVEHG